MEVKVYVLIEEMEGTDGIRCFDILEINSDKNALIEKMNQLIREDEYGLIEKNGTKTRSEMYFESYHSDSGFVSYSINRYKATLNDK